MKILFINQTLGLGGAESFNRDLLSGLINKSVSVTAFTNYHPFLDMLIQSGVPAYSIPYVVDIIGNWKGLVKALIYTPLLFWRYWQIITRNSNADLVVVTGFIEKILVSPLCYLYRRKIIWIEYAPLGPILNKFFGFPKRLYLWALRFPCRVIFPSRHSADLNRGIFKYYHGPTEVILLSSPIPPSKYLCQSPKHFLAVCVSRLEPGKGQDLLIRSWNKVITQVPNAKLNIIGEGDFLDQLQQLTKKLHLTSSVKFLGRADDALMHIARSSFIIFPSVWSLEGFGLTVTESMSVARPVIAFNKGPTSEIINNQSGILVRVGDVDELATAIVRLFSSPQLTQRLGNFARRQYLQKFTPDICIPKFITAFARCLQP